MRSSRLYIASSFFVLCVLCVYIGGGMVQEAVSSSMAPQAERFVTVEVGEPDLADWVARHHVASDELTITLRSVARSRMIGDRDYDGWLLVRLSRAAHSVNIAVGIEPARGERLFAVGAMERTEGQPLSSDDRLLTERVVDAWLRDVEYTLEDAVPDGELVAYTCHMTPGRVVFTVDVHGESAQPTVSM